MKDEARMLVDKRKRGLDRRDTVAGDFLFEQLGSGFIDARGGERHVESAVD